MGTRERILDALVAADDRILAPLPPSYAGPRKFRHPQKIFEQFLKAIHGELTIAGNRAELGDALEKYFSTESILNCLDRSQAADLPNRTRGDKDFAGLDAVIVEAKFAVAENGALWVEGIGPDRPALFLAERFIAILRASDLVSDMHEAYARIDLRSLNYGCFFAGPSKTADIEQKLVIGAHGARKLHVFLYDDKEPNQ